MTTQTTQKQEHRLAGKECSEFSSWSQWEKCFAENTKFPVLLGLLHCAPNVPVYTTEEVTQKYCTLLEIADGYGTATPWNFLSKEEQKYTGDWNDVHKCTRQELAKKALWVLGQTLFKEVDKQRILCGSDGLFAQDMITIPGIYQKLLWFLDDTDRRVSGNNMPHPANFRSKAERNHSVQLLADFVKNFLEFAWDKTVPDTTWEATESMPKEVLPSSSRPQLLKIFYLSDNLDWFLKNENHRKLNGAGMKQLKEMILLAGGTVPYTTSSPFTRIAKYTTLEQALYEHASGAKDYLLLVARRKEAARILAETRREDKERSAEQREQERQNLEKQKEVIEQKLKDF